MQISKLDFGMQQLKKSILVNPVEQCNAAAIVLNTLHGCVNWAVT